jgi:subfamily B ATP-binding cassette protein MsbA
MLVETVMSLAAPWPLKVILDNVVGTHKAPEWLAPFRGSLLGGHKMELAVLAGVATIVIAALNAVASYIDNYFTESVGQWVAHDLRMRVYAHLQHLSLGFYDSHQTGALLSTITDDIKTI